MQSTLQVTPLTTRYMWHPGSVHVLSSFKLIWLWKEFVTERQESWLRQTNKSKSTFKQPLQITHKAWVTIHKVK